MAQEKNQEKKSDVKFLTSLALAVVDVDEEVKHVQFSIVQDIETKEIRAFFDVVDPSKVKLQEVKEDELP